MKVSVTAEGTIARMCKRQAEIDRLQEEQRADLQTLNNPDVVDYDHVTIKRAAEIVGLSVSHMYNLINAGKIRRYDKGGKTCVSLREIEALNTVSA